MKGASGHDAAWQIIVGSCRKRHLVMSAWQKSALQTLLSFDIGVYHLWMKHSKLHGIAHNFADSLAGGLSFVVPGHAILTNVFSEAAANVDGYFVADILTGKAEGAYPHGEVESALPLFRNAFPEFCEKHGVEVSDFTTFLVRFVAGKGGNSYVITIQDRGGRRSSREYVGRAGKRSETLDGLGRRRPKILDRPLD